MRLIDADALPRQIAIVQRRCFEYGRTRRSEYKEVVLVSDIDNAPTIEAEPVRHGRWVRMDDTFTRWKCSECGAIEDHDSYAYCHCGAKMDGGGRE